MAAQLYSHTSLAECLYDVLNEMVTEGLIQDELAVSTLNQLETVRTERGGVPTGGFGALARSAPTPTHRNRHHHPQPQKKTSPTSRR